MKADEVAVGQHAVGDFVLVLSRCVFESSPDDHASFFEMLLLEVKDGRNYYVNLREDPRFNYFGWLGQFERKVVEPDLVEHNAYADALFVKIAQPTWKLHRHSISRVYKLCEDLTKLERSASKKDKRKA